MKAVPGHGRTLKMELLPNILFTLAMLAIGEFEELEFNKNGKQEDQELPSELLFQRHAPALNFQSKRSDLDIFF